MRAEAPIGCRRCGSPVGYGPSVDRRGGIYPARGCLPRRGGAGRCEHRPLQGLAARQGCGFPAGRGPSVDRRGGIYPARGVCAAAGGGGMRASRPTVAWVVAAVRFGGAFRKVCRGGPWPPRETLRHRGVPGTMQASSPTEVCCNAGPRFPGLAAAFSRLAAAFAVVRRGGFHIRPQMFAPPRGSGGMRASRPTAAQVAGVVRFGLNHKIYS